MAELEIVQLGASSLKDGAARWQCSTPANDNDGLESYGEIPVYQGLGLTSLPVAKDDKGCAEGVYAKGIGSKKGILIGGRDTRSKVVGKMDPGDTVAHSTDAEETAQVRLQGKKKSASIVVKGADGKHLMVLVDGKNGKIQVMAKGACIEIDDNGDISLLGKGGAGILIQGGDVCINGNLKLPGMPPGMFIMCAPMTGPITIPAVIATPLTLTPGTWMPCMSVGGYT